MSHAPLEQLTDAVHGFAPWPAHAADCAECRDAAARLEDELALLRRAEARLTPRRRSRHPSVWLLGAAAAMLLAIAALVSFWPAPTPPGPAQEPAQEQPPREPTLDELVLAFMNGGDEESSRAAKSIRERGAAALPVLARARVREKGGKRPTQVADLVFQLKRSAAQTPEAREILDKLDAIRMSVDFSNAPLAAAVDYFREISGLNVLIDPLAFEEEPACTVQCADVKMRAAVDLLLAPGGLDSDVRLGVLLISSPDRLWAPPPPVTPPKPLSDAEARAARAWIAKFASDSIEERERAATELLKLGPAAIPILEEGAADRNVERAGRCKDLAARLKPPVRLWGAIAPAARWRSQKLAKEDEAAAQKLATMRMDIGLESAKFEDILAFVRDFTALNIVVQAPMPERAFSFKVKDLPLGNVLEAMTLPLGLDIRIEGGVVAIFDPDKK